MALVVARRAATGNDLVLLTFNVNPEPLPKLEIRKPHFKFNKLKTLN